MLTPHFHPFQSARAQSLERRERLFPRRTSISSRAKAFAETTVEDITNAADLGKATFFNLFPQQRTHPSSPFAEMHWQAAVPLPMKRAQE